MFFFSFNKIRIKSGQRSVLTWLFGVMKYWTDAKRMQYCELNGLVRNFCHCLHHRRITLKKSFFESKKNFFDKRSKKKFLWFEESFFDSDEIYLIQRNRLVNIKKKFWINKTFFNSKKFFLWPYIKEMVLWLNETVFWVHYSRIR